VVVPQLATNCPPAVTPPQPPIDQTNQAPPQHTKSNQPTNQPKYQQGADQAVRNVYQDVADKYQDVLALETSIAELHQFCGGGRIGVCGGGG
jgi:hypothetical protein